MKKKQVFSVMAAALLLTLAFIGAGAAFTGCSALSEEDASDPNNPEGGGGGGGGGLAGGSSYTVTFNSRGGSYVSQKTVAHGGKVVEPAAPTKGDNILGGWYRDVALPNRWVFDTDTVTGDITLYAKWGKKVDGTSFSNGSSDSDKSAIDLIDLMKTADLGGADFLAIMLGGEGQKPEEVYLNAGDISGGLVLSTVPYQMHATSGYITADHGNWTSQATTYGPTSPANVTINGGKRVVDLTGAAQGSLITVGAGVTLTLKNITFKGLKSGGSEGADTDDNNASLIMVSGGTLILEDKAVISDNYKAGSSVGGGVRINSGNLIMNGGAISNNKAGSGGGGVYVYTGGKFTMSGGDISGNTCDVYAYGLGVGVHTGGEFIMSGGAISNNIFNNDGSAWGNGGGVCVRGGKFTMSGGSISGNSISGNTDTDTFVGGGVGVIDSGEFTMKGGFISGNTIRYGGGVGVESGTFTMKGGTIRGNTATQYGGGVGVAGGTFNKADTDDNSGTIYGSDATLDADKNIVGTRAPLPDGITVATKDDTKGHAVYVNSGPKYRNKTADESVSMDSADGTDGSGVWEH